MEKKYYYLGGAIILLIILGAVLLFAFSGKPKPKTGPINLVWWKTFEDSDKVAEIISTYQQQHKNVTVTYVKKDINTYEQELLDALASGKGPDIFTIHNDWLSHYLDKLSSMPDSGMNLRTFNETFIDAAAADFIKDNKIYALPLSTDVLALYYNKDLLGSSKISAPAQTWPELVSDVTKLTQSLQPGSFSTSGVALGTSNNVNRAVDILLLLMLQNGSQFYSKDFSSATFDQQQATINNESFNPAASALDFYTQFATPAKQSYTWNTKSDFSIDAFTQGKVAMMLSYAYLIPVIKNKAPNLNWAVAPAPQISSSAVKVNFANYWGEAVSKDSKNAGMAWDFLNFATRQETLTKYYSHHKLPSSRKDILSQQISDPDIGVFAEGALTARTVYKKDASQFETIFLNMIDDVILRNLSSSEAVSNAVSQINLSLQK